MAVKIESHGRSEAAPVSQAHVRGITGHTLSGTIKAMPISPSLVNTSYNMHEAPIVRTPSDAIETFLRGHLDVLLIGPFIVNAPETAPPDSTES